MTAKRKSDNKFTCFICEKSFSIRHNLKVHDKRFHTKQGSDSTYKCDNCNSTFIDKVKLSDHILKEHEKCNVCAKVFQNRESFDTHIEAVHKKPKLKHSLEKRT